MMSTTAAEDGNNGRWLRWLAPTISLTVFALVIYVIHRELAQLHLRDVIASMSAIPASTLLVSNCINDSI